eukprot:TRINITY_DN64679_c0_g1_i1.p1 TRINITY_DN64679_c0_g1~~TRINITY_DN64679_c0_g1_i1.p1  ORF type:complete len:892 (+),score=132.16 TRINITY_DN64679_c0_g1_i1:53-2728(+)
MSESRVSATSSYAPPPRSASTDECISLCNLAAAAMRASKAGATGEAIAVLEQLCSSDDACELWPRLLARAYLTAGNPAGALAACARGRPADEISSSGAAELFLLKARAKLLTGDADAAKEDLVRAVPLAGALSPGNWRELEEVSVQVGLQDLTSRPRTQPPPPSAPVSSASVVSSSEGGSTSTTVRELPGTRNSVQPAKSDLPAASAGSLKKASSELKSALAAEKEGNFIDARRHCADVLRIEPGSADAVLILARMEISNGNGGAAAKVLRKYPEVLKRRPQCIEALVLLAKASEEVDDWEESVTQLERAVQHAKLLPTGQKSNPPMEALRGRLARAHWKNGDRDAATSLAQSVLEEFPTQLEACEVAAPVLMDRGDVPTAISLMLRTLIALRNEPSHVSSELVCTVMRRCPVEELLKVLLSTDNESSPEQRKSIAEVVGFVGLIMRDNSDIVQSCRLYREAALFSPLNGSLCLNLMHAYSMRRDNLTAIAWGRRYFQHLGEEGHDSSEAAHAVVAALQHSCEVNNDAAFSPSQFSDKNAFYDTVAIGFVLVKLLYLHYPYTQTVASTAIHPENAETPWQIKLAALDVEKEPAGKHTVPLRPPVEIGFEEAHRHILSKLCGILDRSRTGRELHMTKIRNEHAYFSCINDIVKIRSSPSHSAAEADSADPLYVIGDSHVLSSAWLNVNLPSRDGQSTASRVLVPGVVTGAKVFHLRKESTFYTKFAFWDKIAALPPGADVVLVLGEIDCREGILRAVQRGKHANIEEALKAIARLYLELIKEVRRKLRRGDGREGRIFIHPIPLVLPETRFLTVALNEILAREDTAAVLATSGAKFLHFGETLGGAKALQDCQDAKELSALSLLPDLVLDGTHMNPSYVKSHLEPALVAALS